MAGKLILEQVESAVGGVITNITNYATVAEIELYISRTEMPFTS